MFLTILTATSATAAEPEEPKTPAPPRPEFRFETDKVVALGDPVMEGVQKDIASLAKWDIFITHVAVVTLATATQEAAKKILITRTARAMWRIPNRGPRRVHHGKLPDAIKRVYMGSPNPASAIVNGFSGRSRGRQAPTSVFPRLANLTNVRPGLWAVQFRLYGRSADEAKKLATVLIDHFVKRAQDDLDDFERTRADTLQGLAKDRTKFSERQAELSEITAYLEKHPTSATFAKELALEFDKQLRLINVEIAGLEAQHDHARKALHRVTGQAANAVIRLAETLRIELAGALARKQAITVELTAATKETRRQWLEPRQKALPGRIQEIEQMIERYRKIAEDPPHDCFTPPIVVDGVVTISALKP